MGVATMIAPYYQDDQVTLYHGDCLELTEWLAADVLVTDPPYGIAWRRGRWAAQKSDWHNAGITNDNDTTVRDAALTLWGDSRPALCFGSLKSPYPAAWSRMLVFEKPSVGCGLIGNRKPWLANWEPVFILGDWPEQTPTRSAVVRTQCRAASGYNGYSTQAGHSHAKPLDVMEQLIDACPSGTVADPFAGSGSTLVAARNLGRRAIGVEIHEPYCELIAKRLDQMCLDFGAPA